jgi:hypothetical protein
MRGDIRLPFVETITGDAQFTGNLGSWTLTGVQQLYGLTFKFWRESSTLSHVAPPRELIVPPFEVSVKPGLAQSEPNSAPILFASLMFPVRKPLYLPQIRNIRFSVKSPRFVYLVVSFL